MKYTYQDHRNEQAARQEREERTYWRWIIGLMLAAWVIGMVLGPTDWELDRAYKGEVVRVQVSQDTSDSRNDASWNAWGEGE